MFPHCIWDPYRGFGWVMKEWMAFSSFSRPLQAANTSVIEICRLLPPSKTIASPVPLDAAEYFAACFHIVFGTHMEALDGYYRNGWPSPPFHGHCKPQIPL